MVAVIDTTEDMMQVLNYNEKKVQQKKAVLIHAGNFLKEKESLNFYDKVERFRRLNELNTISEVNMLHVSINFHPSEKISPELITAISEKYMAGIGLPDQPFLVYQHFDAAHPHFHIVSNLIRDNGKRLRTNNIGKNESRKTADALEKEYGLVRAKDQKKQNQYELKPIDIQKIQYGKSEVKKSIQNILGRVLTEYKVCSLEELNAILGQYNVLADRGKAGSRIYENGGLLYKVLGASDATVGKPIKASDFYFKPDPKNPIKKFEKDKNFYLKPILKVLEEKFKNDKELRKQFIGGIKTRIDWVFKGKPSNLEEFRADLLKEGIDLVIRQNKQGLIYGMTYIDYKSKIVINGSDIEKSTYSAKGVLETLQIPQILEPAKGQRAARTPENNEGPARQIPVSGDQRQAPHSLEDYLKFPELLAELLKAEEQTIQLPYELKKKKRKRGR